MRNLDRYFENKMIDFNKLLSYGFIDVNDKYVFEKEILDYHFKIIVEITKEKQISKIIDLEVNDEYVLADVKNSSGSFVGKIKEEYENALNDIVQRCTTPNIFKSKQAKEIIEYVKEKYKDDLEYLWVKFPKDAVWRNKENNKWYGLLLVLSESKLGLESDKIIDMIVIRYQKDKIKDVVDMINIFKGYHMNKDNWITIRLNDSLDTKEIINLIDNSYKLSLEK